jgi:hypothetical protein
MPARASARPHRAPRPANRAQLQRPAPVSRRNQRSRLTASQTMPASLTHSDAEQDFLLQAAAGDGSRRAQGRSRRHYALPAQFHVRSPGSSSSRCGSVVVPAEIPGLKLVMRGRRACIGGSYVFAMFRTGTDVWCSGACRVRPLAHQQPRLLRWL